MKTHQHKYQRHYQVGPHKVDMCLLKNTLQLFFCFVFFFGLLNDSEYNRIYMCKH